MSKKIKSLKSKTKTHSPFHKVSPDLRKAVEEATKLGNLSIVPPKNNGSKRPFPDKWKPFEHEKASKKLLSEWYDQGLTGIGIVCGEVSDNLECLDFDEKAIFKKFCQRMKDAGLAKLLKRLKQGYLEQTPNGHHLLYRCSVIEGSVKLATRPKLPEEMKHKDDKTKTLIETRGEGGYIICAPSHGGVNPDGTYKLISGSLSSILTIKPSERQDLHNVAKTFHIDAAEKRESEQKRLLQETSSKAGRPGVDFNARAKWIDILGPHGWTIDHEYGDVIYLRRPGKKTGISATLNYQGNDLFHNFSTSTPFKQGSYDKFGVYAVLNHNGDYSAAASKLRSEGFGGQLENSAVNGKNEDNEALNIRVAHSFPEIKFPFKYLPKKVQKIAVKSSKALQCQKEFMAMNYLAVLSGAIGNSVTLAIKKSWRTAPFIWLGIVDETGSGKTHPIDYAMKPLVKLQSVDAVRYEKEMQEYKKILATYKKDKKGELPPIEPKQMRHYLTNNFTIESLIPMFNVSSRGIVIHADEMAGLIKGLNQYRGGRGSDVEQFLSLYNAGPMKNDRKSGGDYCKESGAAVIGGIQPGVFSEVFGDKECENGMIYRFLPMLLNAPRPKFTLDDLSDKDEEEWSNIVNWMYKIEAPVDPLTGCIVKQCLTVDDAGMKIWQKFHDKLTALHLFMPKRFRGYLPKLITYCLKFITVLHMLECYSKDKLLLTVNKSTVLAAIKLTRYFAGQAMKIVTKAHKEKDPFLTTVHQALISLKDDFKNGKLRLSQVRLKVNEMLPESMVLSEADKTLGACLRDKMGLEVRGSNGGRAYVYWNADIIMP